MRAKGGDILHSGVTPSAPETPHRYDDMRFGLGPCRFTVQRMRLQRCARRTLEECASREGLCAIVRCGAYGLWLAG
eukprot:501806-Prymnesium_polylepis.1